LKVPLKRTNPEKGIGVDPQWVEISWDEAYDTAAEKIAAARGNSIIWLQGHGKYVMHSYFMKSIVKALKTTNKIHRGSVCESSRHLGDELTWGGHGFLPDIDNCNYLIVFGTDTFSGEQWARWLDRKIILANERGMKLVVVDPRLSKIAAKADEWIPIIPTTDGAFLLAMAQVLINEDLYDEEFLKKYTNASFLVSPDGYFLRDGAGKELVWDEEVGGTAAYDTASKPALTGTYSIGGVEYKPSFQVFSDQVEDLTPEWASGITSVPAETIRRIAKEFGEAAKIGSTIVLEGRTLRYAPVNIHTFRGLSMHQYGAQTNRARWMVCLLLGNLGAVGGVHLHHPTAPKKGSLTWPPVNADLQKSLLYPFATHNITQQLALTIQDPEKYQLPYEPKVLIAYGTDRVTSCPDPKVQVEAHSKLFQISIEIHMSEMTELADIVIPDATYLESYHWAYQRWTLDASTDAIRQPVVNVYNLPMALSSIMEIAERAGFLYDEGGLNDTMNQELGLNDPYKLELDKKYSVEEVLDKLCLKKTGGEKGLDWFKENGFNPKFMSVEDKYVKEFADEFGPPHDLRVAFYAENIIKALDDAKEKWLEMGQTLEDVKAKYGVKYEAYDPLPQYYEVNGFKATSEYDLYLSSYKSIHHTQMGITSPNTMLRELEDENYAVMNSEAA
ncbi:MAG: molybdopterin-dependent oxidoreductase, partial [Candidatus Bathyarchaeia archaeon]